MKFTNILSVVVVAVTVLGGGEFVPALAESTISGTIRDMSGTPPPHAYVEAIPVKSQEGAGTLGNVANPWVPADSSGTFTLTLAPGRYRIRAKDEIDGYPDPSFWLNLDPNASFPEVVVRNRETAKADVFLGRKGGILTGEVHDAHDNRPIAGAKIRLQDPRNSDAYLEIFTDAAGHFRSQVNLSSFLRPRLTTRFPLFKVAPK